MAEGRVRGETSCFPLARANKLTPAFPGHEPVLDVVLQSEHHARDVADHFLIREPKNRKSLLRELSGPLFVIHLLIGIVMDSAIDFDDQPELGTIEVDDPAVDLMFAAEFQTT